MILRFPSQFSHHPAGFCPPPPARSLNLSYTQTCCQSLLTPLTLIAAVIMAAGAGLPKREFSIVERS